MPETNKCKDCELFTLECWELTPGVFVNYGNFGRELGNKGKCLRDGEIPDSEKMPFENQDACDDFQDKRPVAPW